ncbi:hypothetical protein IWW38_006168, partial [Coemansia aciculifera]
TAQDIFSVPTTGETVVFYVSLAASLSSLFLIAYAIWFRAYPPMRAQHVGISVSIGVGGIIFNVSNNLVQGMAKYDGVLSECKFWGAWVLMTCGIGVLLSSLNMRLVLFYRVFVSGNTCNNSDYRAINFVHRYWPLFAMWLPSVISSIVISALQGHRGAWLLEDHGLRACDFSVEYLYWIYAYFAAQIVLSWVMYLSMRKVAKAFNGFRMAIWTVAIFTAILLITIILNFVKGSNYPWGRIVIAVCNMFLTNGYLWLILGVPAIGHLFWREQTMRNFMNSLHKDGLIAQQTRMHGRHAELHGMCDNEIDDDYINTHTKPAATNYLTGTASITYSASNIRV